MLLLLLILYYSNCCCLLSWNCSRSLSLSNSLLLFNSTDINQGVELEPEFLGSISNVTYPVGREAVLTCSVKNLGKYKVSVIILNITKPISITREIIRSEEIDYKIWISNIVNIYQIVFRVGAYISISNTINTRNTIVIDSKFSYYVCLRKSEHL